MNSKRLTQLALALCGVIAMAQDNTISGIIKDQTGNPILGANVLILETLNLPKYM